MSDAVLKNARVNLEALRRHGQHVDATEIAKVAGLAGHALAQDENVEVGSADDDGGEMRMTDERTQRVGEIAGYPFAEPAGEPTTPRILPGPSDILPGGHGPATPNSNAGAIGHRGAAPMGMDAIVNYSGPGGSGRR